MVQTVIPLSRSYQIVYLICGCAKTRRIVFWAQNYDDDDDDDDDNVSAVKYSSLLISVIQDK